jgi:hypothetical protein
VRRRRSICPAAPVGKLKLGILTAESAKIRRATYYSICGLRVGRNLGCWVGRGFVRRDESIRSRVYAGRAILCGVSGERLMGYVE